MRFPWLQVESDFIRCRAPDAAVVLGVPTPQVIGHVLLLWEWALSRSPEDAPPTGEVSGTHAGTLIERAAQWSGPAGALVDALCDAGVRLLERTATGFRVCGMDRYAETWAKQEKERQRWHKRRADWRAAPLRGHSGGAPAEHHPLDSGATPVEHQRSTTRKIETEMKTDRSSASQEPQAVQERPGRGVSDVYTPAREDLHLEAPNAARQKRTQRDKPPADPRHAPLSLALVAAGWPHHGGRTAKALTALLAHADREPGATDAQAEILRRAGIARAWEGFPQAREIHELAANWGHFAKPQAPTRRAGPAPPSNFDEPAPVPHFAWLEPPP